VRLPSLYGKRREGRPYFLFTAEKGEWIVS
jgi:hypothetical protein